MTTIHHKWMLWVKRLTGSVPFKFLDADSLRLSRVVDFVWVGWRIDMPHDLMGFDYPVCEVASSQQVKKRGSHRELIKPMADYWQTMGNSCWVLPSFESFDRFAPGYWNWRHGPSPKGSAHLYLSPMLGFVDLWRCARVRVRNFSQLKLFHLLRPIGCVRRAWNF